MVIGRTLFATLVLFFTVGIISAQENKINFTEYDLKNGLHVILHEDHSTPIVAVSVMYHVGSKNEDPERTGFAHFFEHLLFEGSENIGRGEFDTYLENAGGTVNANTSQDRTFYFEVLPSNQLELGLWLESERMLHAKIEDIGIETQRKVIKEEKRQRIDNKSYGSVLSETMKRAFKVHPYQWLPIGSLDHIDAATKEEFLDFYKRYYIPNNAVLSIAGDLNIEETKKLIEAYFGPIPRGGKVPEITVVEPPRKTEVRDTIFDNVQLSFVLQAFQIPAQGTKDFYPLQLIGHLLSTGESSRLNKVLIDETQKAISAGSAPLSLEHPSLIINYALCNVGVDPKEVEDLMDQEIRKLQTGLISEKEFRKVRNQIENDFILKHTTVRGIAETLADYHMHYGDAGLINKEIERYMNVTREDIQAVAKKYFTPERVVLYCMPKQGG